MDCRSTDDFEIFTASICHNLREPLRTVTSFLTLIYDRGLVSSQEGFEFLGFARDAAAQMKLFIDSLHAYSRIEHALPDLGVVDCGKIFVDVLNNLRCLAEETRAVVTRTPLPKVRGDGALVAQLFQNVVENALRYRGEGPPRVHVEATPRDQAWEFSIADNGVGFTPGTEVGMAICKQIVGLHRGKIWRESRGGDEPGSTIRFTLPSA